jgi:hypothetical protein
MRKIKNFLKIFHNILKSIGLDFLKFKKIIYIFKYFSDLIFFIKSGGKITGVFPVFGDHKESNSDFDKHYFYHETIVSNYIFENNPKKHIDIGSRLNGFVSTVASFRKIEFFDLRPSDVEHKNIIFKQIDLLNISEKYYEYTDSLSCLYVLGHVGLGRYGDKINKDGSKLAFLNLVKILKNKGKLYIAIPISEKNKVYFNAHRTFIPSEILGWSNELKLEKFDYVDDNGKFYKDSSVFNLDLTKIKYGCGIYMFIKN